MKFRASSGCPISRVPSTAPIRAGDDLEEMTVRILEIDAPTAIVISPSFVCAGSAQYRKPRPRIRSKIPSNSFSSTRNA